MNQIKKLSTLSESVLLNWFFVRDSWRRRIREKHLFGDENLLCVDIFFCVMLIQQQTCSSTTVGTSYQPLSYTGHHQLLTAPFLHQLLSHDIIQNGCRGHLESVWRVSVCVWRVCVGMCRVSGGVIRDYKTHMDSQNKTGEITHRWRRWRRWRRCSDVFAFDDV